MDPRPPNPVARLFVPDALGAGAEVAAGAAQAHQLRHVLRAADGDIVHLFNGGDGEWSATLALEGKREVRFCLGERLREQPAAGDLWLCFAPVKHGPIELIVEKATELGVDVLQPVITRRTVVGRLNADRLQARIVEAAEQCHRLAVPALRPALPFDRWLAAWPAERRLVVCDETGSAPPMLSALEAAPTAAGQRWAVMIGPEGGFEPQELDALLKLPSALLVGLGPRVLRAETAAIAALAVFQAVRGDGPERLHRSRA